MADAALAGTASIGHSPFEQPPELTAYALQEADKVMYAAKAKGKNGVARIMRIATRHISMRSEWTDNSST